MAKALFAIILCLSCAIPAYAAGLAQPNASTQAKPAKPDWSELTREPHERLLAVHRALLALRRSHPDLVDSDLSAMVVSWDDADRWMVVRRGTLRVVVNLADEPREIDLDAVATDVLFATGELPVLDGETVTLPAESAAVLATR